MAIDKTNLETQVQAHIDGLTGTETLKDLLILSKAAEGLNVNRTALDTAIETALGGLDGASEIKDLLVGNKSAADEVATLLGVNSHTTTEIDRANTHTTAQANGVKTHINSALSGVGGGGAFVPSFISTVQDVRPWSGTLFSLTPPAGERVMLTRLGFTLINGNLSNISVEGSLQGALVTGNLYSVANHSYEFNVGVYYDSQVNSTIPYILLAPDEVLTVSAGSNGSIDVNYQYAFGSIK